MLTTIPLKHFGEQSTPVFLGRHRIFWCMGYRIDKVTIIADYNILVLSKNSAIVLSITARTSCPVVFLPASLRSSIPTTFTSCIASIASDDRTLWSSDNAMWYTSPVDDLKIRTKSSIIQSWTISEFLYSPASQRFCTSWRRWALSTPIWRIRFKTLRDAFFNVIYSVFDITRFSYLDFSLAKISI